MTPSAARRRSWTSAGTGSVVDTTMRAESPSADWPTSMSAMLIAGVAEHRADPPDHAGPVVVADHQHVAGRGHVDAVVVDQHDAGLAVEADERAGDRVLAARERDEVDVVPGEVVVVSRTSRPRSAAICGAFTYDTGSSDTAPNRPFSTDRVRMRVS